MRQTIIVMGIGASLLGQPLAAQVPTGAEAVVARAEAFLRKLDEGDFGGAQGMVGPQMAAAGVTSQMLSASWGQISGGGRLTSLRASAVNQVQPYQVVDLAAQFGERVQWFKISVDGQQRVEGFRVISPEAARWEAPLYADPNAFEEEELTVGAEGWPLGATLTLPRGVTRAPVVVLVHGSGAHDRNETIGQRRPFQDLAWGLASQGVAVLRYEKRTWKHGARVTAQRVTVEEEVIADALSALAAARSHARVDPAKVYLLGHSLGGLLAPEIAVRDGRLAGVILLAGSPRQLPELVLEQVAYLRTLPENAAAPNQAQLDALKSMMEQILRRELPPEQNAGGAPASYFYDLAERKPLEFLARFAAPMMVLQGGRDYQVTQKDYELWVEALRGRSNIRLRFYPDLDHLFVPGEGMARPAEYLAGKGHVDARVIGEISAFVKR